MKSMETFFSLEPETILASVEKVLLLEADLRASGRVQALNSLENRVYDLELEDESHVVTKFYRPGRWTEAQIREEHAFLALLDDHEIPVVAPFEFQGETLFRTPDGIFFTIFPKVRGRLRDELDPDQLRTLGRYIARIHNVGEKSKFRERLALNVENWGRLPLAHLETILDPAYRAQYRSVAQNIFSWLAPRLEKLPVLPVHGDCHLGNTLWQQDAPFFLDFDDMMRAPAVQDIWMVVRGRDEQAEKDRASLLEGYEAFRPFDRSTLKLIEPLRALRMIHYSAWIARRWNDPAFPLAFAHFNTPKWWEEELQGLQEIWALVQELG